MQGDRQTQLGHDDQIRIGIISNIDNREVRVQSLHLADVYLEYGSWSGKSLYGIIAGAEYAARLLVNRKESRDVIAEKYGVSEQTISKRYDEILRIKEDKYGYGALKARSRAKEKQSKGTGKWGSGSP